MSNMSRDNDYLSSVCAFIKGKTEYELGIKKQLTCRIIKMDNNNSTISETGLSIL